MNRKKQALPAMVMDTAMGDLSGNRRICAGRWEN